MGEGIAAGPERCTSRWSTPPADSPRTGPVVAELRTVVPGTAPRGLGRRAPVPGPPPARASTGPGRAASRRQVAATTGRDEPPPVVAGGPENPSAEPVLTLSGRSGSRARARWALGEDVDVGAVPAEPCAVAVRSRGRGRIRTGGGGAAAAERWTGAGPGPDEGPVGPLGTAGADLTGIAAGAGGGAGAGAGAVGVAAGPGPGVRLAFGRVTVDGRSPSSGAPPPIRAVGGSEGSGAPIPPRTRAGAFGPGALERCTEGEGSEGLDDG